MFHSKAFHYVDHDKLWRVLKEMGVPQHIIVLMRNLYSGQEATFKTEWFPIGKGVK